MKINERIRFERKKLGLSREKFVKMMHEVTGLKISAKTCQRWEEGLEPTILEIQQLAEFFEVKVTDLMNLDKNPLKISRKEIREFGENIADYSEKENTSDLMCTYYITQKDKLDLVPRYDIELLSVNSFLSAKKGNFATIKFLDTFFYWTESGQRIYTNIGKNQINLINDSAGSRSFYDEKKVTDPYEMTLIKEGIISSIYWFDNEIKQNLYEQNETNFIKHGSLVKNGIYTS